MVLLRAEHLISWLITCYEGLGRCCLESKVDKNLKDSDSYQHSIGPSGMGYKGG